ncbi:hypothetical protein [Pseudomonas sp. R5(2019)]|nr:hypothetical protein [Pseudomonas sp. R5(2019)]NBA95254.1 hypothetical protein [Pseudomonas sp. R5(2019)]
MNFVETTGFVLCMSGVIAGIGAMIFQAKRLAWTAVVPLVMGAGFLIYSL